MEKLNAPVILNSLVSVTRICDTSMLPVTKLHGQCEGLLLVKKSLSHFAPNQLYKPRNPIEDYEPGQYKRVRVQVCHGEW